MFIIACALFAVWSKHATLIPVLSLWITSMKSISHIVTSILWKRRGDYVKLTVPLKNIEFVSKVSSCKIWNLCCKVFTHIWFWCDNISIGRVIWHTSVNKLSWIVKLNSGLFISWPVRICLWSPLRTRRFESATCYGGL